MDVKIGEQPKIKFELRPAAPVNIHLETKYIRGGDAVVSSGLKYIEPISEREFKNLLNTGAVRDDTLYITLKEV